MALGGVGCPALLLPPSSAHVVRVGPAAPASTTLTLSGFGAGLALGSGWFLGRNRVWLMVGGPFKGSHVGNLLGSLSQA